MQIPFTSDQFFEVFRRYNEAVWPSQIPLVALAVLAVALTLRGAPRDGRFVSAILAILWLWMGVVYHWMFFTAINRAAIVFGALFVVQGMLFAATALKKPVPTFGSLGKLRRVTGATLIAYALLGYPALGALLGHSFPASPTFGLPCPTTIFTFGLLFWAAPSLPRVLLAVPLIWAVIGTWAALALGVREDFGLAVAGLLSAVLLLRKNESPSLALSKPVQTTAWR